MKTLRAALLSSLVAAALLSSALLAAAPVQPVTPDALPQVRAVLQMLHDLSGKYTLTGQHNYPAAGSRNSAFAARYIGRTPVIFASDWGFAKAGDQDSYLARPEIVQEAIRQWRRGCLVAMCWHAPPPTADEPVTFRPLPGSNPDKLQSVQGRLTDEQFRDLLTPGTPIYEHWCRQVDRVAGFLRQLQDAGVPVLWRPFHEMNGDWFWWGGRTGKYGTAALYRQLFNRFVHVDHLRNLIWVWNVDRVHNPHMEDAKYFPGINYVDVLALDVYQNDFAQSYYDRLVKLSQGKPLALAEVGNPPSPEILRRQPRWVYYATWVNMVRNTSHRQYDALLRDPRILNLEDPAYWRAMAPVRAAAGLPALHVALPPADFTGTWEFDGDRSDLGPMGGAFVPARLDVVERDHRLTIRSTRIIEYGPDQVTEQQLPLDGTPVKSDFVNSPEVTTARLSPDGRQLSLDANISPTWAPPGTRITVHDTWTLSEGGSVLTVKRTTDSSQGKQQQTLIYDRR